MNLDEATVISAVGVSTLIGVTSLTVFRQGKEFLINKTQPYLFTLLQFLLSVMLFRILLCNATAANLYFDADRNTTIAVSTDTATPNITTDMNATHQ